VKKFKIQFKFFEKWAGMYPPRSFHGSALTPLTLYTFSSFILWSCELRNEAVITVK